MARGLRSVGVRFSKFLSLVLARTFRERTGGWPDLLIAEPAAWDRYRIYLHTAHQVTTLHLNDLGIKGCSKNPIQVADCLQIVRESMASGAAARELPAGIACGEEKPM